MDQQHKMAAKEKMGARWAWACEEPRLLETLGLEVVESTAITRPPRAVRDQLPTRFRFYLPLAHPVFGRFARLTLFRTDPDPHYDSV